MTKSAIYIGAKCEVEHSRALSYFMGSKLTAYKLGQLDYVAGTLFYLFK